MPEKRAVRTRSRRFREGSRGGVAQIGPASRDDLPQHVLPHDHGAAMIPAPAGVPGPVGLERVEKRDLDRIDQDRPARGKELVGPGVDESDDPPELLALPREPGRRLAAVPAVQSDDGALEKPAEVDSGDFRAARGGIGRRAALPREERGPGPL